MCQVRHTVFSPGYLPQPAPAGTLAFNWAEHSLLLLGGRAAGVTGVTARRWGVDQVVDFLWNIPGIDNSQLEKRVREEEIDGEALLMMTQTDLTQLLGLKLGPAIKIYNAVTAVRMRQ